MRMGDTIKYVRAFLIGSVDAQLLDDLRRALVQLVEVRPLVHVHAAPRVAPDAAQASVQITAHGVHRSREVRIVRSSYGRPRKVEPSCNCQERESRVRYTKHSNDKENDGPHVQHAQNTYGQSLSNSDFFVTNDSSDVSVSTCSGRAHAASSSWPHSSDVAGPVNTVERKAGARGHTERLYQ